MRRNTPRDLSTSVRQKLLNLSKSRNEVFDLILNQYANERFLYRLASSAHGNQFVLKGAALFVAWTGRSHRPTRDLDLLGYGDHSPRFIARLMKEVCKEKVEPDGLVFDPDSVDASEIREGHEYGGIRVQLRATLENARINLRIDVGFGDVIVPAAQEIVYPVLLDFPAPRIRGYSQESVVAEKLEAIVALGLANSRMKDFYDLAMLARKFSFEGGTLAQAIHATFDRRRTPIQREPMALTEEFHHHQDRMTQWVAFLKRGRLETEQRDLKSAVTEIRWFVLPVLDAIESGSEFEREWSKGGPWL